MMQNKMGKDKVAAFYAAIFFSRAPQTKQNREYL